MKNKRKAVFRSIVALLLCFSMFIGTTFAWFTDSVSSGNNLIATGNLDVELEYMDKDGSWQKVDENTFVLDKEALWEPGRTEVVYLRIKNTGDLALKYALGVKVNREIESVDVDGNPLNLSDHIRFGVEITDELTTYQDRAAARNALTAPQSISQGYTSAAEALYSAKNTPEGKHSECYAMMVVYMPEDVGNAANYATGAAIPEIDLGIALVATQEQFESDSFGSDYDAGAEVPDFIFPSVTVNEKVTADVTADADNKVAADLSLQGSQAAAAVPQGVQLAEEATALTLSISELTESQANITVGENEEARSLNVHIEGVASDNTVPMAITMAGVAPRGLNAGNLKLYHVENGETVAMTPAGDPPAHNQFHYDPATGDITLYMATFSEVALVADTVNAWNGTYADAFGGGTGTEADPYLIANADQLAYLNNQISAEVGCDAYYKLIADINLGGEENANKGTLWYPIGYHKNGGEIASLAFDDAPEAIYEITEETNTPGSVAAESGKEWYTYGGAFKGTFDGAGHTISNIYQNTWQLKGNYDGNYWNAAMGLFGYVYGGTVKNLTVNNFSSDGEFTPTGVIAAYAAGNATFENIAIVDCNPRVYNTGNGGIIGIAGDTSAANDDHITLKNITVDNSNKISALWGSWDVACGGLVGMYRGNVDGSGNATGDTISFENCHVSAQIDVYNDVCANYQYYAYRYAGMIIGSIRHNTTNEDGKTIPNMAGISATGCTVNYGDWNDYYYCEFEKNTIASYSEDYQFSRIPHSELNFTDSNGNGVVDANERASVTGCKHTHTAEEDKQAIYLPFHQLFTGYSWGVSSIGLKEYSGIVTDLDITEGDQEKSVEKFETKFTGDFLYRVGNQDTVPVGSLFAAVDGATISDSGVQVTIDKVDENTNVSGTFTANTTDWTKGTIQFSGTGVVKVTIQDYNFCKPTELYLEVVDAVNATSVTSATKNNVVLLQDCGFSSLEVSGGYTLYGNGFTMTCGSDSAALDMGYSFVTLNNGTLDNVQIVCPNFDYAVLYKSNMTESGNRSETIESRTRYFNVKSGVMVSGNSQILNSRISGGRAAVNVSGGNVVIDNSRIELGAVASVLVGSANSLTLRDVTLVQKPTVSTYDSNKKLMGFSVLFVCDANGDAAPVTLEGTLVQNAWIDENDKQYVPSAGQSIVTTVMQETEYLHDINGDGTKESLNLGFAYMPESLTSKVNSSTITDNRTNKDSVPYDYAEVSILNGKTYVYSYKNTNGTNDSTKEEGDYIPTTQSDILTVTYSDTAGGLESGKSFGTDGWVYELNVDLDKLSGYALDFSKLSMSVNGTKVTDFKVNGSAKPTSPVAVTAGGTTYTLTATVNGKEYTAYYKVTGTETSKESPSLVTSNYEDGLCVASSYGGTWSGAAPALEGIQIKYWSVAEKQYKTINLSDYTPTTKGKLNDTNNTWTYSPDNGDFTLTLTGGQVHSSNNVYAMPVSVETNNNGTTTYTLYFVAASSNGLVNTGNSARTIPVSYSFKDNNNGDELTFSHTWSVAEKKDAQYKYSDFCNGTLTKLEDSSGSGSCVTPDTLITLANGKQVRVDSLTGKEELLVWNLETGKLDSAPIMFVDSDPEAAYEIVHLYFSDGTDVKVIYEHGFWDYDLNRYVYLDRYAQQYIGHTFAKQNGDKLSRVKLTDVVLETEVTTAWSPVTAGHLCYFVNGMLSMPGGVGGLFNIFEVDPDTMTYDYEAMAKDIETYGLFTYEEMNAIAPLSEDMFNAAGGAYLKISIGKGNLTVEELVAMINRYSKYI